MCGLWLWKRTAARIRGFVRGAGVKVRATRGRPPSGWLHQLGPHQRLVPGARIGATQGARSPTGAYAGKGWFVSHVVLVERLVVDALW